MQALFASVLLLLTSLANLPDSDDLCFNSWVKRFLTPLVLLIELAFGFSPECKAVSSSLQLPFEDDSSYVCICNMLRQTGRAVAERLHQVLKRCPEPQGHRISNKVVIQLTWKKNWGWDIFIVVSNSTLQVWGSFLFLFLEDFCPTCEMLHISRQLDFRGATISHKVAVKYRFQLGSSQHVSVFPLVCFLDWTKLYIYLYIYI